MAVPKIYNEATGKWEPISYPAGADISAEAGNAIVKKSDGLYAPNESETTKKLNNSLTLMVSNGGQMRVTNFDGSEDKTVNLTIPADQDTKYSLDKSGTSLVFTETLTSGAKNINNVDLTDSNVAVGSNTLAEHLDTVPTFSVVGTPTVDAPSVNADLLEGHNAAYFANQSQISALTSDISSLQTGKVNVNNSVIIDNANDANEVGLYRLNGSAQNVPFESNVPWMLFNTGFHQRIQIAWLYYPWEASYNLYVRFSSDSWSDWRSISTNSI